MEQTKIPVAKSILEGLESVRLSSETNMFDIEQVIRIAAESGYYECALWVCENRCSYINGILLGFEPIGGDR